MVKRWGVACVLLCMAMLVCVPQGLRAQGPSAEVVSLMQMMRSAAAFDHNFPREKVYLHLDNNAYYEDETIWFQAYVVRASAHYAAPVSRVLYVDLLDAGGRLIEQCVLKLDSVGRAEGKFTLELPVKQGFHEIRAYTREMVNWGAEACYSRVIPVFERPVARRKKMHVDDLLSAPLTVDYPADNAEPTQMHPRIISADTMAAPRVQFYPEGGERVEGLPQRVAFQIEGSEKQCADAVLKIYSKDGQELTSCTVQHDGMGTFLMTAAADGGYAMLGSARHELPEASAIANAVLSLQALGDGVAYQVQMRPDQAATDRTLGVMVMHGGRVCYADTLCTVGGMAEGEVAPPVLRHGVHTLYLFDASGRCLAQRLFWQDADLPRAQVKVRQSARQYEPYAPIALEFEVTDETGAPLQTDFSLSVRSEMGEMVQGTDIGASVSLLLASEVRGYIHRPQDYFSPTLSHRRAALDALLMVQGWQSNTFEELAHPDAFQPLQPIEEGLTLNGRLLHDNEKMKPLADTPLRLKMYSPKGMALEAETKSDAEGRFALVSNVDYTGDLMAQFTATDAAGHPLHYRLTLDRWFAPAPRDFHASALRIYSPTSSTAGATEILPSSVELFEWNDTIPQEIGRVLGEAVVKGKKKYRGLQGNRYSYGGGEKAGMRQGDFFINLNREYERYKDAGGGAEFILDFLALLDSRAETLWTAESDAATTMSEVTPGMNYGESTESSEGTGGVTETADEDPQKGLKWRGRTTEIMVNNDQVKYDLATAPVEWFQSVAIAPGHKAGRLRNLDPGEQTPDYLILLYENPESYRIATKKGVEKRRIKGYTPATKFYHPDYRRRDMPEDTDVRRTLCWMPSVKTDANGRASVILYNNGTPDQQIRIVVRGISPQGHFIEFGE